MNNISFKQGLKVEWETLRDRGELDQNCLYFCIDTHEIYKGGLLFGTSRLDNMEQSEGSTVSIYGGSAIEVLDEESEGDE